MMTDIGVIYSEDGGRGTQVKIEEYQKLKEARKLILPLDPQELRETDFGILISRTAIE